MASRDEAAALAPARPRSRPRPRPKRAPQARPAARRPQARPGVAGGLAWIVVAGVLLAGIVALNVAVLRLNVQLDDLNGRREQLRAGNAELGSRVSSAASSARIQALARAHGFVAADPATTGFVDLSRRAP